ncbi:MAG: ABC transporter ATP-binding protein, partial [Anaerolineae bacterium]
YPAVLSGGMKQRAALLRTFLTHREVLLLDEPFGALDALTRMELQEWLLEVWERFRKTILFVTHDVDEAVFLSDRVYVLTPRPGRVRTVIPVPLPRPRARSITASPEFAALRYRLLEALALR